MSTERVTDMAEISITGNSTALEIRWNDRIFTLYCNGPDGPWLFGFEDEAGWIAPRTTNWRLALVRALEYVAAINNAGRSNFTPQKGQ